MQAILAKIAVCFFIHLVATIPQGRKASIIVELL